MKIDFSIPWEKVEESISEKTKCIVINSPHNPTGAILTEEDIIQLQKIIKG